MNSSYSKVVSPLLLATFFATAGACGGGQNVDAEVTATTRVQTRETPTAVPNKLSVLRDINGRLLPESGVVVVSGGTAQRLVNEGATLIDVRTPQEFADGHIAGAINVPHTEIGAAFLDERNIGGNVVLYCGSGRRAGLAFNALRADAYTSMVSMGAISNWPSETGNTSAPESLSSTETENLSPEDRGDETSASPPRDAPAPSE